jgi:hypothetical protein
MIPSRDTMIDLVPKRINGIEVEVVEGEVSCCITLKQHEQFI